MQQVCSVGQLAKCHTKRCLELQNNGASHTTFVGVAHMSPRLVLAATCMLICLLLYNSSQCSLLYFNTLEHSFIVSWNTCSFLVTSQYLPFSTLFLVFCLLFLILIIYLFIALSIFIVYVGCLSNGVCYWIFIHGVEYFCQWVCFYV